jgi:hypothetical protein
MYGYFNQELFDNPIYSYGKAWINRNGNINYEYCPGSKGNKYLTTDDRIVIVNFITAEKQDLPGYECQGELKEFIETIMYFKD